MISSCHLKQLCNSSSTFNINKFLFWFETFYFILRLSGGSVIKNPPAQVRAAGITGSIPQDQRKILWRRNGCGHSGAWKIPWIEKRGGAIVLSLKSRRNWACALRTGTYLVNNVMLIFGVPCGFTVRTSGRSCPLRLRVQLRCNSNVTGWTVWLSAVPSPAALQMACQSLPGHTGKLLGHFCGLYDAASHWRGHCLDKSTVQVVILSRNTLLDT